MEMLGGDEGEAGRCVSGRHFVKRKDTEYIFKCAADLEWATWEPSTYLCRSVFKNKKYNYVGMVK